MATLCRLDVFLLFTSQNIISNSRYNTIPNHIPLSHPLQLCTPFASHCTKSSCIYLNPDFIHYALLLSFCFFENRHRNRYRQSYAKTVQRYNHNFSYCQTLSDIDSLRQTSASIKPKGSTLLRFNLPISVIYPFIEIRLNIFIFQRFRSTFAMNLFFTARSLLISALQQRLAEKSRPIVNSCKLIAEAGQNHEVVLYALNPIFNVKRDFLSLKIFSQEPYR